MALLKYYKRALLVVALSCGPPVTETTWAAKLTDSVPDRIVRLEAEAKIKAAEWNEQSIATAINDLNVAEQQCEVLELSVKRASILRTIAQFDFMLGNEDPGKRSLLLALRLVPREEKSEEVSILALLLSSTKGRGSSHAETQGYLNKINAIDERFLSQEALAAKFYALADKAYNERDTKSAIDLSSRSVEIWSKLQAIDDEAFGLLLLGYAHSTNTAYSTGLELVRSALEKFESTQNKRGIALSNIALGNILTTIDDKQAALNAYQRAERMFPSGVDQLELARLFNGMGHIYEDYGLLPESLDYRKKALALFRSDHHVFGELAVLIRIAKLEYLTGDETSAHTGFLQAMGLARRLNDKYSQLIIEEELADFHFFLKSFDHSKAGYLKFVASADKLGLKRDKGPILNKLGRLYQLEGDEQRARQSYIESIALSRELVNPITEADALFNFATLHYEHGRGEEALDVAAKSLELTNSLYANVDNSRLKTNYHSTNYERYKFVIGMMMSTARLNSDNANQINVLRILEQSFSQAMLEGLALAGDGFTSDAEPGTLQRRKELLTILNAKSDELTQMLSDGTDRAETEAKAVEIRDIQLRLEEIRAELKQKSPIYSAIKNPEPFDVGDFQANVLDENSVLLEFSLGTDESYLWAVDRTSVNAYYLPPRDRIEARVEKLRGLLSGREILAGEALEVYQKRIADADAEYLVEARALSEELLWQAADKIKGKRLIVVADGRLNYFPIGSLPMPGSGSDEPILLGQEVVYEPSASALKLFKMETKTEHMPSKDLLVYADPVFSKSDERLTGLDAANAGFVSTILGTFRSGASLDSMPRLPASELEAKSISDVVGINQTTVRSGFAANRESVINSDITDYKILHFATHGLIDEKRPELSGILLSLFDKDGKPQDGGFIRLQDVYGLNLHADLVVLSACDTGIGKEVKGEGVMSLNNAFLQSGAKSVVSSLWKVDDNATKELMTEFYRGIAADGLTASAALRQAQIKMYNDPRFRSPFFWAAFTAQGDYQRVPQISRGFGSWIYIAGIFLLLMFGIYGYRRFLTQSRKIAKTQR